MDAASRLYYYREDLIDSVLQAISLEKTKLKNMNLDVNYQPGGTADVLVEDDGPVGEESGAAEANDEGPTDDDNKTVYTSIAGNLLFYDLSSHKNFTINVQRNKQIRKDRCRGSNRKGVFPFY
jgi:hypothetical protein